VANDGRPSSVELGILGAVTAARGGKTLDLGGPQPRSVLALLVLGRGDTVSAEGLIDALWGESPPASATASLHSHISRLRRQLDGRPTRSSDPSTSSVLVRVGTGYRLDLPRDAVDAWRFERMLDEAPALAA
jgi:DNA-binding SARP family transcriptional activator